jgi:hypothetical protein
VTREMRWRSGSAAAAALCLCAEAARAGSGFAGGLATVREEDLREHASVIASPAREGRDTPSTGLVEAALYLADRFRAAGLVPAPDSAAIWRELGDPMTAGSKLPVADDGSTFLRPFRRRARDYDREASHLSAELPGTPAPAFVPGIDFVPLPGAAGTARGELVFAGFGIVSKTEHWDELAGLRLRGKIALVIDGEPRDAKRFDGREVSRAASFAAKLADLKALGAAGALLVRLPEEQRAAPANEAADPRDLPELGFRHSDADFVGADSEAPPSSSSLPAAEVTPACASRLLGEDVQALAARIEKAQGPVRVRTEGRTVEVVSELRERELRVDNVVGVVPGGDLASEFVVVGAHYDHLGLDRRGRIACGADDNASGTAALVEIAEAFATAGPRRSVLVCAFAGEEDGLLGSRAFCDKPPVARERLVAMLNLDMIGRGAKDEVAVLGILQNPGLEKVLVRAKKLSATGVREITLRKGEELFERSDHYSFHRIGVPSLFFFEGLPISKNPDYHTWRDTLDKLDFDKVLRTTRLVFNTAWLLTNDDERPARP